MNTSVNKSIKVQPNASVQINKSNVTLWKNSNYSTAPQVPNQNTTSLPVIKPRKGLEESKQIESEFIENLKKQIYFMEMELKLMKEREHEIQKSGGFTQLFNDEREIEWYMRSEYADDNFCEKVFNNSCDNCKKCSIQYILKGREFLALISNL